jgi:hypothetical protein
MSTEDDSNLEREHVTGPVGVPLETQVAIHSVQLANGQKEFARMRDEMAAMKASHKEIEVRILPKPINWMTLVFGGVSVLVVILGAWWTLSQQFSDRPTRSEFKSATSDQQKSLDQQATELRTVRDQQTEQRVILNTVREEVKETGHKIDLLLQDNGSDTPRRAR